MDESRYTQENLKKKKHPIERANIMSKIFFCWLLPYFVKGFKKNLTEDDMYAAVAAHDSEKLGDKLQIAWEYELVHKKNPSLLLAILKVFYFELVLHALAALILELGLKLSQPILISKLLGYYENNPTHPSKSDATFYAGLIVLTVLIYVLAGHSYMFRKVYLGMKVRVAVSSLIYRKALKLSKSALAETTIGQMVNLLSNDVSRFDFATQGIHNLWMAPVLTVTTMILLYTYVGPTGLVGAFFLLLFVPFQIYMGKKISQYRLRTAIRTDERVRLMNEIISGIQIIKMYTWEKPFATLVELSRRREIQQIRATSTIRAILMCCNMVLSRAAIFLSILTYVLTGNIISASYAFTIASFHAHLRSLVTLMFPIAVTQFAETMVSIKRIKNFLLYEEMEAKNERSVSLLGDSKSKMKEEIPGHLKKMVGIYLKNVSVKWIPCSPDNTLENITFQVDSNQLVAIVGPVGGGKSTLLHVVLKELPQVEGSIEVEGTVSYASQEPWLFGGSVRQNIIFGNEFDIKKYQEVVRVCALQRDFSLLPYGDRTLVGARGVTLSGGQKARISLARAIYKDADIYLLDDPLSAVDTHVGRHLFDDCICGYLKEKCVVLVTHQLQYLGNVDTIYLIDHGKVEASGSYSELKESDSEFANLLADSLHEEEEKADRALKIKQTNDEGCEHNEKQDVPTENREETGTGTISRAVYKSYLQAGGGWCKTLSIFSAFVISQVFDSLTDYFATLWTNLEQWRSQYQIILNNSNSTMTTSLFNNTVEQSSLSYLAGILTQQSTLIIYSCLILLIVAMTISRAIAFFRYCMTASINLHNQMFYKIVHAPMRFFNTNPPGTILNRFSKDIGSVDELLPMSLVDTVQIGLAVLFTFVLIGSLNVWVFIPTVIILIIFYFMRVVFLATSRDIKRVESVTRSPIYTHLTASLQGLTTIRAFGAQKILTSEFDNYQNKHSSAFFMFFAANRTFGFWLDFFCFIYISLVMISILFIENEEFGGNVGLALTQALTFTGMFQWGMRQWTELENQMISVERIQEFIDLPPEVDEKTSEPPKFWPEHGRIKIDKLCLRYSSDEPYVLTYLTFEVRPKEKIGIVGRTGAGKSSLIAALFRLTPIDGKIIIDNVNTKEVSLQVLRSKISVIPQEPVLFSGTLRKNLDPFDEYNDDILWNALDEVELKNAVTDLQSGLDSKMSEGGSNFSVGQRQLVCLARAIIRNNKILILDEATANIDPQTDALIQTTIRRKFADCTVLTIAHRLHTIMDSDRVLVMDAGQVVEFDNPYVLLQKSNGIFKGLVLETGKAMAENLTSIAKQKDDNRNK